MSYQLGKVTELPESSKTNAGDVMRGNPGRTSGTIKTGPEIERENTLSAVNARQGVISGRVFLVLLTSVALAVLALGIVYLVS